MNMKQMFFVLAFILFVITPCFSELYKYIDENGVTRFTDSYAEIPEDLRNTIVVIEGEPIPETSPETTDQAQDKNQDADELNEEGSGGEDSGVSEDMLKEKRNELEQEFDVLIKDRKTLMADKKNVSRVEFNEKVSVLNKRIKDYENRKNEFDQMVDQFNRKLIDEYLEKNKKDDTDDTQ